MADVLRAWEANWAVFTIDDMATRLGDDWEKLVVASLFRGVDCARASARRGTYGTMRTAPPVQVLGGTAPARLYSQRLRKIGAQVRVRLPPNFKIARKWSVRKGGEGAANNFVDFGYALPGADRDLHRTMWFRRRARDKMLSEAQIAAIMNRGNDRIHVYIGRLVSVVQRLPHFESFLPTLVRDKSFPY